MIDFNNLSTESYAAFIIAIVFTVVSIAGAIVLLRRLKTASTLLKVLTTIVFPFIAIFCWLYMILNVCANFDIGTSFYSAFLITLGFYLIVVGVYFLVQYLLKRKAEKNAEYVNNLENEVKDLEQEVSKKEAVKAETAESKETKEAQPAKTTKTTINKK